MKPHKMWGFIWDPNCLTFRLYISKKNVWKQWFFWNFWKKQIFEKLPSMQRVNNSDWYHVWSCSLVWIKALQQTKDSFCGNVNVRHHWRGRVPSCFRMHEVSSCMITDWYCSFKMLALSTGSLCIFPLSLRLQDESTDTDGEGPANDLFTDRMLLLLSINY